jgi:hypothetical protein
VIIVFEAVDKKQLLTYLRLADKRLGLLVNFNVALIGASNATDLIWVRLL